MKWHLLKIKAIADENDPLEREVGSPLWEERYPIEKLEEIKQFIGKSSFSALFQQEPIDDDDDFFYMKGIQYFNDEDNEIINDLPIRDNFIFLSVDPAYTTQNYSDYTVIAVCGKNANDDLFVYEVFREKIPLGQHTKEILRLSYKYNTKYVIIETNSFQAMLETELISNNLITYGFKSTDSKQDRAALLALKVSKKQVFLKARAKWLDNLISEFESFPLGKHDDQIDALSFACLYGRHSSKGKIFGMKAVKKQDKY